MEKAIAKTWAPEELFEGAPLDTPYKRATQEWDLRMGRAVVQAKNWRVATFASLATNLVSLAGMIYLGAQPKAVPHIVQVDKLGAPTYVGPVGQSAKNFKPSDASLRYHLRRFVDQTRSVSSDVAVLKRNWLDAYNLITSNAANQLNAYAQKAEPFKRVQTERVSIDVLATVQISRDTWQVDWRETSWDKSGNQLGATVWRGTFRVIVRPPTTDEQLVVNPIGLLIDEFHWSKMEG
jgi:type IV secretion system protein VirB5